MFLNSSILQYTPRAIYGSDKARLTDNNYNYYGFLESKEYQDVYDRVLSSPILTMDVYNSPYFGEGNGGYRELDRVYEEYRAKYFDTFEQPQKVKSQEDCPEGYLYFNEYCVPGLDPITDETVKRVTTTTSTISPALILAAAAAFFFAG